MSKKTPSVSVNNCVFTSKPVKPRKEVYIAAKAIADALNQNAYALSQNAYALRMLGESLDLGNLPAAAPSLIIK